MARSLALIDHGWGLDWHRCFSSLVTNVWTPTDLEEGPVVHVHEAFNAIRATLLFTSMEPDSSLSNSLRRGETLPVIAPIQRSRLCGGTTALTMLNHMVLASVITIGVAFMEGLTDLSARYLASIRGFRGLIDIALSCNKKDQ